MPSTSPLVRRTPGQGTSVSAWGFVVQLRDLKHLVASTGDAAFAIDSAGVVVAWNESAEAFFAVDSREAVGSLCWDLVRGTDETGVVCSPHCPIQQSVRRQRPVANYDIQVQAADGRRWCNASVLRADLAHATKPYSIHILRGIDVSKRFDLLLRDIVVQATGLPPETARRAMAGGEHAIRSAHLSRREFDVLRLLATGASTSEMAAQLRLQPATVNNHVAHILRKLEAHSRLEAVRRAEQAGLI